MTTAEITNVTAVDERIRVFVRYTRASGQSEHCEVFMPSATAEEIQAQIRARLAEYDRIDAAADTLAGQLVGSTVTLEG